MISKIRLLICNIINFSSKVNSDNVPAYSAHASFFLFISAFPFIMILMTLIKYTPLTEEILLQFVGNLAPNALGETVISWINEIYRDSVGILSISIILTLWSASKGFLGIISSLNFIYDTPFKKNYFFKRFIAMFYTLALLVILVITIVLIVFGNKLLALMNQHFPVAATFFSTIIDFRLVIALGMFFLIFLAMYRFVPNRKSSFKNEAPGALFTTAGWLLFSVLYSVYVTQVNMSTSIYGSLTTVVLFMLWLYFCMFILFLGAEINVMLSSTD